MLVSPYLASKIVSGSIVTQSNDDAKDNHLCSHSPEYSPAYFSCREYHQNNNKQPYNHSIKLPDGRSGQIRFSGYPQLTGSVTRSENKRSALFGPFLSGTGEGR
ncbi:hypothetical protein EKN99_19830 [Enterobacter hormaechei]|nr:hypothetical protein AXA51_24475 [Enterobacter hormaechei]QEL38610.1 hypothetical protein FY206_24805 [Enterobacter chengduensis]RTM47755.1 hypothetical protein EKO10_23650 [Enterobacter hormaechei subsp. xiangfangensis]RYA47489.1 hypothetical protein DD597_24135 [Enterobacter cloacae complex sp. 677-3DZ2D5B]RYA64017.1 hypothetical protein DD599_15570 [Enterobacter cloacae complex sp. CH23B]RYA69212.1 hypothetical protein DD598_20680 [Enterobacter cloacae complex sp. 2DZ2F16B1]RYA73701.1 h